MSLVRFRPKAPFADVAHPVERHLAKVEVASSSLVIRSNKSGRYLAYLSDFFIQERDEARTGRRRSRNGSSGGGFVLPLENMVALLRLARLHRFLFSHSNPLLFPPQAALRDFPRVRAACEARVASLVIRSKTSGRRHVCLPGFYVKVNFSFF